MAELLHFPVFLPVLGVLKTTFDENVPLGIALVVFLPFFALLNSMCMALD